MPPAEASSDPVPNRSLPEYAVEPGEPGRLERAEWLLTNGIGGYSMGTASGIPTRRYHGLLVASLAPPVRREVLLHSTADTLIVDPGGARERTIELCSFRFRGAAVHPRGVELIARFARGTAASWLYRSGEIEVARVLHLHRGRNAVSISYRVRTVATMLRLDVRPLAAMRDAYSLLHKDAAAHEFTSTPGGRGVRIHRGGRTLELAADAGSFEPGEQWWHGFDYAHDRDRGYDHQEDLFSPGVFSLQCRAGRELNLTITAWLGEKPGPPEEDERENRARLLSLAAAVRSGLGPDASPGDREAAARLAVASDDFVVQRGEGRDAGASIIAGYPWFSDWGRDAMISLPGLLLTTGRFAEARRVLETFARHRRRGLIPNLFNDQTGEAEYNTVDASLWFLHAACECVRLSGNRADERERRTDSEIISACIDIVDAYRKGTDHGIRMDPEDGLIAAGDESTQLTWMDARRDGHVFTPRHGKAVEINALWHHGLLSLAEAVESGQPQVAKASAGSAREWRALAARAAASFRAKFWNAAAGCCFDVLTPAAGRTWIPDPRIRPNQVFAAGLRHSPLADEHRRGIIACIGSKLLTPRGLRTLDPADPGYKPRYRGTMWERDAAYHNGTAWPWLLGPYAEAVMRVGGFSAASRREARDVLRPLIDAMNEGESLGQIPEVFDAEAPQHPGGCPAQAWSVAEALRVWLLTFAQRDAAR